MIEMLSQFLNKIYAAVLIRSIAIYSKSLIYYILLLSATNQIVSSSRDKYKKVNTEPSTVLARS